jgi:hypothetical protein
MAPRLVSLLSLIEKALVIQECPSMNVPGTRSVNFSKGLARYSFGDGSGAVVLQSFLLADGQICIKAALMWAGSEAVGQEAVYPRETRFSWDDAADRIASAWMAGPPKSSASDSLSSLSGAPSFAAAG